MSGIHDSGGGLLGGFGKVIIPDSTCVSVVGGNNWNSRFIQVCSNTLCETAQHITLKRTPPKQPANSFTVKVEENRK